jgi:hypothetical protein
LKRTKILFVSSIHEGPQYLERAVAEGEALKDIFEGYNTTNKKFFFDENHLIDRAELRKILKSFEPDIIHFTGHGSQSGLIFQDGQEISPTTLKEIFENLHAIQLVFLNACYSINQVSQLKNLTNIGYIIGMKDKIAEIIAEDFAITFYKLYKENRDIVEAFEDALKEYEQKYDKLPILPELIRNSNYSYKNNDDNRKNDNDNNIDFPPDVKVIQNEPIPDDMLSQIQRTIRIFEEEILTGKLDLITFWNEKSNGNISSILMMLMTYSREYGIDKDKLSFIRESYKNIQKLINNLNNLNHDKQKELEIKNELQKIYEEIITSIFKKIYYDYTIDSIENVEPLLPAYSYYENFGEITYIIYSFINSLHLLRQSISESVIMINDELFINNTIIEFSNFLHHMKVDYKKITKLIEKELNLDIKKINLDITSLILNLESQLLESKINLIILYESLDNVFEIDQKINLLFEKVFSLLGTDNKIKKY